MKRLGIFSIGDREGKINRYVLRLIDDISHGLQDIIIVCAGQPTEDAETALEAYTPRILIREGLGFEVGAWQQALLELGPERADEYDEIVMFDDSFYGPLRYGFSDIFSDMENVACNFWGLTVQFESRDTKGVGLSGYLPTHLNTSFIAVRKRMFSSKEFWKYWKGVPYSAEPNDEFGLHELFFTEHFTRLGFKWSTYVPMADLEYDRDKNYNHSFYNQYELISQRNCPVLFRKPFGFHKGIQLSYSNADDLKKALDFVRDHTPYDTELIYDNLLRVFNNADLHSSLHLKYVLPSKGVVQRGRVDKKPKIAVIMHMFYPDIFAYCCEYAKSLPYDADLFITTNTDEKCQKIRDMLFPFIGDRLKVLNCGNRGRDVAALLVTCRPYLMNYDYLCFVHDKKSLHLIQATGASYQDVLWDNMLKSQYFVEQVIELFNREPRLGLLSPPGPYAGSWFGITANTWTSSFDVTKELYDRLGLTVNITQSKRAVALGTVFWCRPVALKQLFEYPWKYTDFPKEPMGLDATLGHAIERILSFVAQENGYYTGWLFNDEYAALEISNLHGMIDELVKNAVLHQGLNYCEGFVTFINCLNTRLEFADKSMEKQPGNGLRKLAKKILPQSLAMKIYKRKERIRLHKAVRQNNAGNSVLFRRKP